MTGTPGHHALRKGRHSQPDGVYLVTFVTRARQRVFADFTIACAACRTFESGAQAESATLLCWILMPDHFHGLVAVGDTARLSRVAQRTKSASAHACVAAGVTAQIWARAFHDHALRHDEDLPASARYIVANPVRAGLVKRARDYPFWDAIWL